MLRNPNDFAHAKSRTVDNVLISDNVLEGDNILTSDNVLTSDNNEKLYSALVDLHSAIPVCPQEPSLYRSSSAADGDNEDDDNDHNNDQISDNDEGLRLAKRRQLSSPHDGPPLKQNRKVHFQLPHNGLLRSSLNPDRSRAASVPARLERHASSRCNNQPESRKSSSPSPTGDEEPTSNAGAAYQEWPMRGFFKLITIGNEVRYAMEFNVEDVQQLCAAAFPLHTSSAGSNASFSARPSRRARPFSACAQAENASSRSKRPRFTEEEDAKLVDLKERRGWSWEDIQRSFPGRSTGSLQVRYSTKLKNCSTAGRKDDTR
jgi:hypothetical protein